MRTTIILETANRFVSVCLYALKIQRNRKKQADISDLVNQHFPSLYLGLGDSEAVRTTIIPETANRFVSVCLYALKIQRNRKKQADI